MKIERISRSTVLKYYRICFWCMFKLRLPKFSKTKVLTNCFYLIKDLFKKQKRLELISLPHCLHDFWKIFLRLCFINWPNFIDWLPLLLQILGKRCWDLLPNSIKNSASLKKSQTKINTWTAVLVEYAKNMLGE